MKEDGKPEAQPMILHQIENGLQAVAAVCLSGRFECCPALIRDLY